MSTNDTYDCRIIKLRNNAVTYICRFFTKFYDKPTQMDKIKNSTVKKIKCKGKRDPSDNTLHKKSKKIKIRYVTNKGSR